MRTGLAISVVGPFAISGRDIGTARLSISVEMVSVGRLLPGEGEVGVAKGIAVERGW